MIVGGIFKYCLMCVSVIFGTPELAMGFRDPGLPEKQGYGFVQAVFRASLKSKRRYKEEDRGAPGYKNNKY